MKFYQSSGSPNVSMWNNPNLCTSWGAVDLETPNQHLVGGAITILKNMKVNGKDYPIYIYILWKIKSDWNHQPANQHILPYLLDDSKPLDPWLSMTLAPRNAEKIRMVNRHGRPWRRLEGVQQILILRFGVWGPRGFWGWFQDPKHRWKCWKIIKSRRNP